MTRNPPVVTKNTRKQEAGRSTALVWLTAWGRATD
jgi:hypothetical protein